MNFALAADKKIGLSLFTKNKTFNFYFHGSKYLTPGNSAVQQWDLNIDNERFRGRYLRLLHCGRSSASLVCERAGRETHDVYVGDVCLLALWIKRSASKVPPHECVCVRRCKVIFTLKVRDTLRARTRNKRAAAAAILLYPECGGWMKFWSQMHPQQLLCFMLLRRVNLHADASDRLHSLASAAC